MENSVTMPLWTPFTSLFLMFGQTRDFVVDRFPFLSPFILPLLTLAFGTTIVFLIFLVVIGLVRFFLSVRMYLNGVNDPRKPNPSNPYAPYPDLSSYLTGGMWSTSTKTAPGKTTFTPSKRTNVPGPAPGAIGATGTYWAPDPCPQNPNGWTRQITEHRPVDPANGGHMFYRTANTEYVPYNQVNGSRAYQWLVEKKRQQQSTKSTAYTGAPQQEATEGARGLNLVAAAASAARTNSPASGFSFGKAPTSAPPNPTVTEVIEVE
ncbi:hypothetical protein F5B19DRAFT_138733 [Rostrohypoxylon terebratum]|nr:hypothetical protein F5B19DRAFT_138733 [Rostrohypoxylon terebratum]